MKFPLSLLLCVLCGFAGNFRVMATEFESALAEHQAAFNVILSDESVEKLAAYYELVMEHNPLLHLVGPCSAEEFAVRHMLESLTLLEHLPDGAKLADVGTGAGLPSIPCMLVREDLRALLIESKEKKAAFLTSAIALMGLTGRATVANRQYSETAAGDAGYVTSRALDKFAEKLPHLVRWARPRTMLLFGGETIRIGLEKLRLPFDQELLPLSERRYLFVVQES